MPIIDEKQQPQGLMQNTMQRINVRTMKKDIKRLREADAKKEGQNILKLGDNGVPKPVIPFKDPSFDATPSPIPKFKAPEPKLAPLPKVKDKIYSPEDQSADKKEKVEEKIEVMAEEPLLVRPRSSVPFPSKPITITQAAPKVQPIAGAKAEIKPEAKTAEPMAAKTPGPTKPELKPLSSAGNMDDFTMFPSAPGLETQGGASPLREVVQVMTFQPIEFVPTEVKKEATETEKQQIFMLEGQFKEAEHEITEIKKKKEPILVKQKNNLLAVKQKAQDQLVKLVHKERTTPEFQKEELEKQRWSVEKELADLEKKMKDIEDSYKKMKSQEKELVSKTAEINKALKSIAANIRKRKAEHQKTPEHKAETPEEKTTLHEKKPPVNEPKPEHKKELHDILREEELKAAPKPTPAPLPKPIPPKPVAPKPIPPAPITPKPIEKPKPAPLPEPLMKKVLPTNEEQTFLNEVAPLTKTALDVAAKEEEEKRRKFMEDVEHWAAMNSGKKEI